MKSISRLALVLAVVAALLSAAVGAVAAQETEPLGYLAVVNGASTDPVDVAAGTEPIATDLEYAADGVFAILPESEYTVAFTGGSIDSMVAVEVAAGSAQTVVSGFGEDPATTAFPYPIDMTPIDAGMARVTVWNATGARVDVAIDGETPETVEPGAGLPTMTLPADTPLVITIDGVDKDIATLGDSYPTPTCSPSTTSKKGRSRSR